MEVKNQKGRKEEEHGGEPKEREREKKKYITD